MKYCGIDLHSNNSVVIVSDEADRIVFNQRLPNDLGHVRSRGSRQGVETDRIQACATPEFHGAKGPRGHSGRPTKEIRQMVKKTKQPASVKQPWHAVSVVGGPLACPAIEGLRDKRFLSDAAPQLPLPECPSPWRCKCVYRHFSDRRAMPRRATDRGTSSISRVGEERRERKRRRRADEQSD
jgi:hypothetical protein